MASLFLRPYQREAVSFFSSFYNDPSNTHPLIVIKGRTGTGKSIVMSAISKEKNVDGRVLVLVHRTDIITQLRALGLEAHTIQSVFRAFREAREARLYRSDAREYVSKKIGISPDILNCRNLVICIDEFHYAAERGRALYEQVLKHIKCRLFVGFSATPRYDAAFPTHIMQTHGHSIDGRGSIVRSNSMLSVYNQTAAWPTPSILFFKSVPSAALQVMILNLVYPDRRALLLVGSPPRGSLYTYASRTFTNDNALDSSEMRERKIGIITALLCIDTMYGYDRQVAVEEIRDLENLSGGMPSGEAIDIAIARWRPDLSQYMKDAVGGHTESGMRIAVALSKIRTDYKKKGVESFRRGEVEWGATILKLREGFDLPELRAVHQMEPPVASKISFLQQIGRASRRTPHKEFYDVIDYEFLDPLSSSPNDSITWKNMLVQKGEVGAGTRKRLEESNLVFREPINRLSI